MKRRNCESRARMQIIQEQHMDKDAQRGLDQMQRRTGVSYVKILKAFRAVDRIKSAILSVTKQLAAALAPAICNLTVAARKWMEEVSP